MQYLARRAFEHFRQKLSAGRFSERTVFACEHRTFPILRNRPRNGAVTGFGRALTTLPLVVPECGEPKGRPRFFGDACRVSANIHRCSEASIPVCTTR